MEGRDSRQFQGPDGQEDDRARRSVVGGGRDAQRSTARRSLPGALARARVARIDPNEVHLLPGAVRIPEHVAPNTMNRSWAAEAQVEIPRGGAEGPIVVMGGDTNGWSLYLKERHRRSVTTSPSIELTYIRAAKPVAPGRHVVRYEFEKRGKEPFGAGGIGRIFVDGQKVAEGEIPTTTAFGYSLDETFDIGCDKGAPVTDEYPRARFVHRQDRQGRRRSGAGRRGRRGAPREGAILAGHAAPVAASARCARDASEPRCGCLPRARLLARSLDRRDITSRTPSPSGD